MSQNLKTFETLVVRLITPSEVGLWEGLMAKHHYLGYRGLVGRHLRYVATWEDQWVALLVWADAALCCKVRDDWIGWHSQLRTKRLRFVVNNARFLILPGPRIRNLASKILSINLKRLSLDWSLVYGHSLVLAETFVDPTRFFGTCYRAQGWTLLGHTRGFGKRAGKYFQHSLKKLIFVKPLTKQFVRILSDPLCQDKVLDAQPSMMNLSTVTEKQAGSLIDAFRKIPDPRSSCRRQHPLVAILCLSVCAVLSGAKTFLAIGDFAQGASQTMLKRLWCRFDQKKQRFVAPCEATIRQTLNRLDPQRVDDALSAWLLNFARKNSTQNTVLAIDGKTLCGSQYHQDKPVHLFSALLHREGVVCAQQQVKEKTNEINAVVPLFAGMELEGAIVTADAMHAQKKRHATLSLKNKPTMS
jgi:hypothetical protein